MITKHANDSAIAYGELMLALFFLVAALLWLVFSVQINIVDTVFLNPRIEAGTASVQTAHTTGLVVEMFKYLVPVVLIGGFFFAVRRAFYVREGGS
jgi:ABC-type multidrug transport system permease subunit